MAKVTAEKRTGKDRRLANLKPIRKGEVRNPAGKNGSAENLLVRDLARQVLAEKITLSEKDATGKVTKTIKVVALVAMLTRFRNMAIGGDVKAGELVLAYAYGKPTQPLANDPDNPLFTGGIAEAVQRANGELGKDEASK